MKLKKELTKISDFEIQIIFCLFIEKEKKIQI